jgi:phage-related protein
MGSKDRKGAKPIRFRGPVYDDLRRIARVMQRDLVDVAEDLIKYPLASLKSKLSAELAQLDKMEAAESDLAAKARKKVKDGPAE